MNEQEIKNYAVVRSFDVLHELGNVESKMDFSRFYCGRNPDYFSMILRSAGRQVSVGAIYRLIKSINFEIERTRNVQARKKLNKCVASLQTEVMIRLDRQASLRSAERMDASPTI